MTEERSASADLVEYLTGDELERIADRCGDLYGEQPERKSLLGSDRLVADSGNHGVRSALVEFERFIREEEEGDITIGVGRSGDGVMVSIDAEDDVVEHGLLGTITPDQARQMATSLEYVADIAEDPPKRQTESRSLIGRFFG